MIANCLLMFGGADEQKISGEMLSLELGMFVLELFPLVRRKHEMESSY